jgi:hypothetical protein
MGICCSKENFVNIEENSKIIFDKNSKESNSNNEKTSLNQNSKKIYNSGPILKLLMSKDYPNIKKNDEISNRFKQTEND